MNMVRNDRLMKITNTITATALLAVFVATPFVSLAVDAKEAKPYPLKTCVVSDEQLGGDPSMKPYVFVHEGRQIKLCCESCLKDFKKDTAKYLKKIEAAEKKAKK